MMRWYHFTSFKELKTILENGVILSQDQLFIKSIRDVLGDVDAADLIIDGIQSKVPKSQEQLNRANVYLTRWAPYYPTSSNEAILEFDINKKPNNEDLLMMPMVGLENLMSVGISRQLHKDHGLDEEYVLNYKPDVRVYKFG